MTVSLASSKATRLMYSRIACWRQQMYRRPFVRSSTNSASSFEQKQLDTAIVDPFLARYLSRLHIQPRLHEGICSALIPVYGKPLTVEHLKSFGKDALLQLAESVESSLPVMGSKKRTIVIDIPHHQTQHSLQWHEGLSLLELTKSNFDLLGEYMEGTCGGTMSCCTCHVYLSKKMYQVLPEPCTAELDMLDLAYEPRSTSRLGCQVRLNEALLNLNQEDMVVTIPAEPTNVWS